MKRLTAEELSSPKLFRKTLSEFLRGRSISERDAWEFRARALRKGEPPLALFIWFATHPKIARERVTNADEDEAREAMKSVAAEVSIVDELGLGDAFGMERPRSHNEILKRIRELKRENEPSNVRRHRVSKVRHRRTR